MTRKYKYQGPVDSSVTLRIDGQDVDVVLFRGSVHSLPPDHDYVKTLIALKHLVPAEAPAAHAGAAAPATTKKGAK